MSAGDVVDRVILVVAVGIMATGGAEPPKLYWRLLSPLTPLLLSSHQRTPLAKARATSMTMAPTTHLRPFRRRRDPPLLRARRSNRLMSSSKMDGGPDLANHVSNTWGVVNVRLQLRHLHNCDRWRPRRIRMFELRQCRQWPTRPKSCTPWIGPCTAAHSLTAID